jgi:branched-chain amino acid transport system substrate-binding protein
LRKLIDYSVSKGHDRIVLAYTNNAWSLNVASVIKDESAKNGGMTVVEEFLVSQDSADFRTELTKVKNLAPDAVFAVFATDDSQGLWSKQAEELGLISPTYIPFSRAESQVLRDRFAPYISGMVYPASKAHIRGDEFAQKYEARFGKLPGAISAAISYDMTTLVLNAIKEGAKTPDDIRDYLENVRDYNGFSNVITFNADGQVASEEVVVKQITDDGYKIIQD